MQKIRFVIWFATAYLFFYTTTPYWTPAYITMFLFSLSPFVVMYMVWRVLTKGTPSHLTFEEAFYEDYPARMPEHKKVA
ncbi:MAG: hypothetical protein SFU27_12290 [Thermonemataceae bacterium]|nr:hypothetical protein [Thermonemataceae bacterium]